MRTNIIEELKKIEINISNQNLTHEETRFFSIRFHNPKEQSISELSEIEIKNKILNLYNNILKSNPEKNSNTSKPTTPNLKLNYKLTNDDYILFEKIYNSENDNPLFTNINYLLKNKYSFTAKLEYRTNTLTNNLIGFLNLNLNNFDAFFAFFLTFIGEFIDKIPDEYRKEILYTQVPDNKLNDMKILDYDEKKYSPLDIKMLQKAAKSIYAEEINHIIEMQNTFKNFVDYIFNNNNETYLKSYSIADRFYIYTNINPFLKEFSKNYNVYYPINYVFNNSNFTYDILSEISNNHNINPLTDEKFLLDELKKYSSEAVVQPAKCCFSTSNIYTYFYIILYNATLSNNIYIKKCLNCNKYFEINKSNVSYCDTQYEDGTSCKSIGNKLSQKRKENNEPIYGKYRQIYAKKAMMVKRNPDIQSYKTNYETWKKGAKSFLNEIKNGTKSYEEFDKWLDKK